jgi:hypothetical protein
MVKTYSVDSRRAVIKVIQDGKLSKSEIGKLVEHTQEEHTQDREHTQDMHSRA